MDSMGPDFYLVCHVARTTSSPSSSMELESDGSKVTEGFTYKGAGVNITTANAAKRQMKAIMKSSDPRILADLERFASLFEAKFPHLDRPVLVLKSEEPGSKQLIAFENERIRSVSYDMINHLINDIIVTGAEPLAVLDTIICGLLEENVVVEIVRSLAEACNKQDCSLIGGETSEQPGVLPRGRYVLSATALGVVAKSNIIDGSKIEPADSVVALSSNGIHTNGYSLVRKIMEAYPDIMDEQVGRQTFLDSILRPHRCYYQPLRGILSAPEVHGLAHVTGGGMQANLERILPEDVDGIIDLDKIRIRPIFDTLRRWGRISDLEMMRTFNMGVGMILVADPSAEVALLKHLNQAGCESYNIGAIAEGERLVRFKSEFDWGDMGGTPPH